MDIEMIIENPQEGKAFMPVVEEGITWTTGRVGTPGQLDFTVIKDNIINFQEGNRVQLKIDGTPVFLGFVFKKKRNNANASQRLRSVWQVMRQPVQMQEIILLILRVNLINLFQFSVTKHSILDCLRI